MDGAVTTANFVRTECPQFAFGLQGRVARARPPVRPGGLAWAACRIDGSGHIEEILFARRPEKGTGPAVDYTLVLRTTPDHYADDHAAFAHWLATVRIARR